MKTRGNRHTDTQTGRPNERRREINILTLWIGRKNIRSDAPAGSTGEKRERKTGMDP